MKSNPTPFPEAAREEWSRERQEILRKKIKDFGLRIEGTRLEKLVARLHGELEAAGIRFKPRVYLSNEWSCPDGIPVIGIPFYLADQKLTRLEEEMMEGIEAQTDEEILGYLRHEAGHAFNYAYKLYETEEWHGTFGPYSRPYREDFIPSPFSRDFVRHIPGWYAQKHPDEDFAETFAVWLDPSSNWREAYRDWGCYRKLDYVDRTVKRLGATPPPVTGADYDPGREEELQRPLEEHYRHAVPGLIELPAWFDGDLKEIFGAAAPVAEGSVPAAEFLKTHRRELVEVISYWTGLYDVFVRSLVNHFTVRAEVLRLRVHPSAAPRVWMDLISFATTLCMNKLYREDFIPK